VVVVVWRIHDSHYVFQQQNEVDVVVDGSVVVVDGGGG